MYLFQVQCRYRVSHIIGPTLFFCNFSGSGGTFYHFSTALEICYIIATRILTIDLEIAEIIEAKVGTRHLEIDILLLVLQVPTLTSIISAIYESIFNIHVANFQGC